MEGHQAYFANASASLLANPAERAMQEMWSERQREKERKKTDILVSSNFGTEKQDNKLTSFIH